MTKDLKPFMIHVPKTGGSWARLSVLRNIDGLDDLWKWGTHQVCNKNILSQLKTEKDIYKPVHKIDFRDYSFSTGIYIERDIDLPKDKRLVISIARHPLDMLVSHYFDGETGWSNVRTRQKVKTFNEYILAFCNPKVKWWSETLRENLYFQTIGSDGKAVVDVWMCNTNDLSNDIPSLNLQLKIILRSCYSKEVVNKLSSLEAGERGGHYSRIRKKKNWMEYYTEDTYKIAMNKTVKELKIFNDAHTYWKDLISKYKFV